MPSPAALRPMPLELFPFRYRDARTGGWVNARCKGTSEEIATRHAEWEIIGPAASAC